VKVLWPVINRFYLLVHRSKVGFDSRHQILQVLLASWENMDSVAATGVDVANASTSTPSAPHSLIVNIAKARRHRKGVIRLTVNADFVSCPLLSRQRKVWFHQVRAMPLSIPKSSATETVSFGSKQRVWLHPSLWGARRVRKGGSVNQMVPSDFTRSLRKFSRLPSKRSQTVRWPLMWFANSSGFVFASVKMALRVRLRYHSD